MVTNKIVLEHGGEISFDSEEGVGTTFTIVLPSAEVARGTAPADRAPDQASDATKEAGEGAVSPEPKADSFG